MTSNKSFSDNAIPEGTLAPPASIDETNIALDSSIQEPPRTESPVVTGVPLAIVPDDLKTGRTLSHDPLATALFNSDNVSEKNISFEESGDKRPSGKTQGPQKTPKVDSYPTINEQDIRIPGFKLQSELGRGAFGVVYRAYDEMLDRDVAIKIPILNDPNLQKQYIDEARKAVKLEHPGIVQTYHVGVAESGKPFVVQKLIEGTTLRAMLKERGGALSLGEALAIIRPVCSALEAAHAIGMVHRDLKPENLLIDLSGRPFVADFGLAVSDDEDLSGRTEIAGTPLYMSPEQFSGRTQWIDGRSDIWAIGVIFYEILVGKSPFYAESLRELREQILEKDPRPIHQRQPNIPPAFDAIFRKCCAKQTRDRFGSVRELIEAIDLAIDALPEQSILELMPELHRDTQSKRIGSQNLSSVDISRRRKFSSDTSSSAYYPIPTPSRIVRVWNLVGPLIAVVCTASALALMYFVSTKDRQTASQLPHGSTSQLSTSPSIESLASIPPRIVDTDMGDKPLGKVDATGPIPIEKPLIGPSTASVAATMIPLIEKPFRVSRRTGDGTHDSLVSAIADSVSGDTIIILEGTYREPVILDKDIKLVGQGDRNNVILQTDGQPCLVIRNNAAVHLENLKLKTNGSGTDQANTLDVEAGELRLTKCFIVSNSYDCVKLRNDSQLIASDSDFQSSEHATIRAEVGTSINVEDCDFILHPDSPDSMKKVCIQAEGASGKIVNSRFKGPCMAGVEWRDQTDGELAIEQCTFNDIRLAVSLTNCNEVLMRGTKENPFIIKNCEDSVWIRNSTVTIDGAQVTGNRTNLRKGIAVQKNSQVTIVGSLLSGFETGLAVDHSTVVLEDTAIRDSVERNVWGQSSNVTLEDVELVSGGPNGLHISGKDSTLVVTGALIADSTSGFWIEGGKASLNQVFLRGCTVGIIAGINAEMASKVFSDLAFESSETVPDENDSALKTPESDTILPEPRGLAITGVGLTFSACGKGFVFMSPGELKMEEVKDDFSGDPKRRLSTLNPGLSGVGDYSHFNASWKSIRERVSP